MITNINKIIFLDFDGVITTWDTNFRLNKDKLVLLGKIIEATDCSLIISSSWRSYDVSSTIEKLSDEMDYYNNHMKFPFCDRIIGITDRLRRFSSDCRGTEIKKWIEANKYKGKYAILDDDRDMLEEQLPFFINTDQMYGLSEENVKKAINILNN